MSVLKSIDTMETLYRCIWPSVCLKNIQLLFTGAHLIFHSLLFWVVGDDHGRSQSTDLQDRPLQLLKMTPQSPLSLATLLEDDEGDVDQGCSSTVDQVAVSQSNNIEKNDDDDETETIEGVLFGRSVRSTFASLNLVVVNNDDGDYAAGDDEADLYHVLVRIQFYARNVDTIKELRSYFRRYAKHGDLIRIRRGIYQDAVDGTEWKEPRYVVHVPSIEDAQEILTLQKIRYWTQSQWQAWHTKYYRQEQQQNSLYRKKQQERVPKGKNRHGNDKDNNNETENGGGKACCAHHSGVQEKRKQGEYLAKFLLQMIAHRQMKLRTSDDNQTALNKDDENTGETTIPEDPNTWVHHNINGAALAEALEYLNGGSGVLDVAGGSGHVSMNLGLQGVQSTVVDPREAVGRLPGKDRKIWSRALKRSNQNGNTNNPSAASAMHGNAVTPTSQAEAHSSSKNCASNQDDNNTNQLMCQPIGVRPFQAFQAWFGEPPPGVDTDFRTQGDVTIPICDSQHELVQNCRAILALHPDEATDQIVDVAVQTQTPFLIVPCCVFCRLFPHRRMPRTESDDDNKSQDAIVSSYNDLLQYLQAKHPSIQRVTLPFVGANTILYSAFDLKQ